MPYIAYPDLTYSGRGDVFILTKPLIYHSNEVDITFQVPIGFPTDLASIPRLVRPLLPVVDRHANAAVLHDFLCRVQGEYKHHHLSRSEVDYIFRKAMNEAGVPYWKRWVMYLSVRSYGLTFQRF